MAQELDNNMISRLNSAMSRASKLIQLESNGTIDKIAKGHRDGLGSELLGEGDFNTASHMTTRIDRSQAPIQQQTMQQTQSKLPSAILESFKNNTIDVSVLGGAPSGDLSFLTEGLGDVVRQEPQAVQQPTYQQPKNVREIVSEGLGQHQYQPTQGVDYPMIRTIVEEAVRKYTVALKKSINESKGNEMNLLTIGKTFKFMDSKGNIYEAVLKKVGNINDKKRGIND